MIDGSQEPRQLPGIEEFDQTFQYSRGEEPQQAAFSFRSDLHQLPLEMSDEGANRMVRDDPATMRDRPIGLPGELSTLFLDSVAQRLLARFQRL
ncbi:hypothetical protein GY26_19335 [Gammaproteobacteria bacterium MFB021]|nr:hypothetical protein GY26_19335 [Gammaproteobacteria bacterium MFB021]